MNEGIADDSTRYDIVINGIGVRLVVSNEGAAVNKARAVAYIDEVASDVGMQHAIRQGDLAVLSINRIAVIRQQFDMVQRHIRKPSRYGRPLVYGVITCGRPFYHSVLDDAAIRIVQLAAPFPPFSIEMRERTDVLEIIRTWKFEKEAQIY